MTGKYKIFKIFLLLSTLFRVGHLQATFLSISQNFCLTQGGEDDNLSCSDVTVETGNCFDRSLLCDGTSDCTDGADEGISLSSLECK